MTIEYCPKGNIFDSTAQVLVNPVNCVGIMGAGLAKQFADNFPDLLVGYREMCRLGKMQPGTVPLYKHIKNPGDFYTIALFPTKNHWREPSELEYIESGLQDLHEKLQMDGYQSVAIPKLGCGLGGLRWNDVDPLICAEFSSSKIKATLYG